jgi:tRNA A58 N-methylase Trm61
MTMEDTQELSLDPQRDAWLTPYESANWDSLALISQFDIIGDGDVAAVFGAGSGGIASWLLNERKVAHVIVVEDGEEHFTALRRNFSGRAGATCITDEPSGSMASIIAEFWPAIVVVDLKEKTTEPDTVMALLNDNESVAIMVVIYEEFGEREQGLHNTILTWHDESERFVSAFGEPAPFGEHRPGAMIAWYTR